MVHFKIITHSYLFVLLILTSNIYSILSLKTCDFPAIFNFGDSNSDTGGLSSAFIPRTYPYGMSYDFHDVLSRRACDGRLIIDFIAKSFNIPYLSAYLNSMAANYTQGANFATGSSTITLPRIILPAYNGYSPFYFGVQFVQFLQFMTASQEIKKRGGFFANLMPKEEYFGKAIYTFDIGQNDLGERFQSNTSIEAVNASVPDILSQFAFNIRNLHGVGARTFWIHNTGPIGCLPYIFLRYPKTEKDKAGCSKPLNEVAQYFNQMLKETVRQFRMEMPSASFIYVDVYSVKYSLFAQPKKLGFELPRIACCGCGNKYNYTSTAICSTPIMVNGTIVLVGACDRPSVRVVWDGIHYTQAANYYIFKKISSGKFSDPPVPLQYACNKDYK